MTKFVFFVFLVAVTLVEAGPQHDKRKEHPSKDKDEVRRTKSTGLGSLLDTVSKILKDTAIFGNCAVSKIHFT